MTALASLLLAVGIALGPVPADVATRPPSIGGAIHVDCADDGALQRALGQAGRLGGGRIVLHGLCKGSHTVTVPNVTLAGADPDSGLVGDGVRPVIVVDGVHVALVDLVVRDGYIGVLVEGWESSAYLAGVRLIGNYGGAIAGRGGELVVRDIEVTGDGVVGLEAQFDARLNVVGATVSGQDNGVVLFDRCRGALTDAVIEDNRDAGLAVFYGSSVNVFDSTLRRNGDIHVYAGDRSDVSLARDVTLGEDGDDTPFALFADDRSTIGSFASPDVRGDVYASANSSIGLGNATVSGAVVVASFSDGRLFNVEATDGVACDEGGRVSCRNVTTPAVTGCDPALCAGPPPAGPTASHRPPPELEARPFPTVRPR